MLMHLEAEGPGGTCRSGARGLANIGGAMLTLMGANGLVGTCGGCAG